MYLPRSIARGCAHGRAIVSHGPFFVTGGDADDDVGVRWHDGGFDLPDLERGSGFFGCGGFAGIPFFVFLDGDDSDFGLHVVVAGAAELAAGEFEFCRAGGGELHPLDGAAGDGVLVEAEGWDVERVDHIAGAKEDMDGFADGNDELGGCEIVFADRVCGIDAEFVFEEQD